MEMFNPKFSLKINIISSGKSHMVKAEAMVEDIFMLLEKVEFNDEKQPMLGYDNSTGTYITTYND